ncbi:probable mitochondrial import inner membrane translocase subunit TIM21 isoform X1 [Fagus crenata]
MGAYKNLSGLWRKKQLDGVIKFLSETTRSLDFTRNPSMLSAIRPPLHTQQPNQLLVLLKSGCAGRSTSQANRLTKDVLGADGLPVLLRGWSTRDCIPQLPFQIKEKYGANIMNPLFTRSISSKAFEQPRQTKSEKHKGQRRSQNSKDKEIQAVEDVFNAPTYNIPEKPVTFVEGASYTAIILAGLGVAAAAVYAVFSELIFRPREYQIFSKALKRVQADSQVSVRIGSPITGYGQESKNRAARQRIPRKIWLDEEGVEHVEINFHIRGPHGAGVVFTEMFRHQKEGKEWKYLYLIVEIRTPTPSQLILESYMPAYNMDNK